MASEGGSAMPGRDPAWKYCSPIEGNRNGTICNFYELVMKNGGIMRFKSHLTHKDPHNNTKKCPRVPPEVKEEIRSLVHDKKKARAKKNANIEDIRSQLRGTMGTHHTHLVNEDDDDEDTEDEDVYMYPTDMHPDERDAYRSVISASKASNWEREQHENIVGSKHKPGESSTGIPSTMRKSQSMQHSHHLPPIALSFYKSSATRQKKYQDIFKGGAIKETMGRLISKFFIYESVAPAKGKSHHFKNMIIGAQQAGMGIEPPSPYEIKTKYLEMEYKEMEAYTPCAAHCIDLIFEDIGKRPNVIEVINNAHKITNFIYNHGWLLAQMRKYCGGDIVRPGATSFSYNAIVYELMHVMKENLIRQGARDWMFKIIQDRWEKTLKHPLHAAAYFLNPRFQYRREVGSDPELLQAVHDVFAKLDPTIESLSQFGNELLLFRDAKRGFNDRRQLQQAEVGEEEDNQLFQWVRPIHLDDEVGNPDPRIAAHAQEFGAALNSHQKIDFTNAGHSSRPSAVGTSTSGYDGSRDEDHGSRRAGPSIGAIGKPYRGRERMMEPYNEELLSGSFESMSIRTQFSDSSNEANVYPPHVMSYG
ncbi:hypothetical protein CK203_038651 [Vitis vinifera]|uniref:BED-type domain-containing protein n=1 Tax=Vitis vinifera TaxID=29760 RepID=A0A438HUX2_VITVI|nr:hypothetical protein CK203_038651 [Vitis vinifera]